MAGKMALDKITPDDKRITHQHVELNGRQYHYIDAFKSAEHIRGTVVLVHGFPDIWLAWRYQIPILLELGLRVVAIDCMGYGETDAPQVPPEEIELYTFKRAADDIAALAKHLNAPRIILGGHDWGGMVVYRTAQWYPKLVSHVFSVCTPFMAVHKEYISTDELVQGPLPQFGYQLHFAGPEVESVVQSKDQIRQCLQGMYGGRTEGDQPFFRPETGLDLSLLGGIGMTPLLDEDELDYYTDQFARSGMHGPCNWYRTREQNFKDELKLDQRSIHQPTLFIQATKDSVLKPEMSTGMEAYISDLTRKEVAASHWALWHAPQEVNAFIKEWMEDVVFGKKSVL